MCQLLCGFGLLSDPSSSAKVFGLFLFANAYCVLCTPVSVFLGRDARLVGFFATAHGAMLWSMENLSIFEYSNYSWIKI